MNRFFIVFFLIVCEINQARFYINKQQSLCSQYDACTKMNSNLDYNLDEYSKRNCYCDSDCAIYNDCCENYPIKNIETMTKKQFMCNLRRTICDEGDTSSFIYSIGDCPNEYQEDILIKLKCQKSVLEQASSSNQENDDKFFKWPFYSNITNFTYNNIYCAICNGEKMINLQPWQAAFTCDKEIKITNNPQILDKMKKKCSFTTWMSSFMHYRYCRNNLISTCLKNDSKMLQLESKCKNGPYKVRYAINNNSISFRNEFCAECSGFIKQTCLKPFNSTNIFPCIRTDVTWSLFFDFNFFEGEYEVGFRKFKSDIKVARCDKDSFYDPFSRRCRKTIYQAVNLSIENNKNCKFYKNSDIILLNEAKSNLHFDFELVDYTDINISNHNMSVKNIFENSQTEVALVCYSQLIDSSEEITSGNELKKFKTGHHLLTVIGITISLIGLSFLLIIYIIFPQLRNLPGKDLICLSISYICVYLIMIASMFLAKPVELIFYSYMQQNYEGEEPRSLKLIKLVSYTLAVMLHYAFLCTFSWLTIISFDISSTLRDKGSLIAIKGKEEKMRTFKLHLLFGYIILPCVPVIVGILLDNFLSKESKYAPKYGYADYFTFWISNRKSLFVLFTIPVSIMLLLNLAFFVATICSIIKTDQATMSVSAQRSRKSRILLFVKLSTIMGISWLLGLLAGIFDKEWLFVVYTICNVFQGFFIFLCFIFNRKVLNLLKCK